MQNSAGTADQVLSTVAAAFNTWVHLVAVYDTAAAAGSKMKLYVNNGTPVSGAHATAYGTTNPIQIGRTRWAGAWTDPWDGEIDDVRTYQRALTAADVADVYSPPAAAPMTAGISGALQGAQQGQQSSTAVAFSGSSNMYTNTLIASPGPATLTLECWFRIGPGDAGVLVAYNSNATGSGGSYDRVIYMDVNGKLRFGVNPGATTTVTSASTYDDGAWHYVAASLSGTNGMRLYVDGVLVASNGAVTTAGSNAGYWRWGGSQITGWNSRPNNGYLVGSLDEMAVYSTELTAQQIGWHYHANH